MPAVAELANAATSQKYLTCRRDGLWCKVWWFPKHAGLSALDCARNGKPRLLVWEGQLPAVS